MTEHDRQLVEEARYLGRDWEEIVALESQAETAEGLEALRRIAAQAYHRDEGQDI